MSQIATGLLRSQFQLAHNWFEGTVGDIAAEQMHWAAGGKTSPIGGMYAHVILAEDAFVNAMLKGARRCSPRPSRAKRASAKSHPIQHWASGRATSKLIQPPCACTAKPFKNRSMPT
jgi:hypothetical protein